MCVQMLQLLAARLQQTVLGLAVCHTVYQFIGNVVVRRSSVRQFPSRIKKWAEKSLDRLIKLEIQKLNLNLRGAVWKITARR